MIMVTRVSEHPNTQKRGQ